MKPRDLIATARDLAASTNLRPRQSNLLRASSTTYYALFHTLARCSADMMIGTTGAIRSKPAWQQVYRALQHGCVKSQCLNQKKMKLFPNEIQDFANVFVSMQEKRHKADYDPTHTTRKSEVMTDIEIAEEAIDGFENTDIKHRRAFAAWVLFQERKR